MRPIRPAQAACGFRVDTLRALSALRQMRTSAAWRSKVRKAAKQKKSGRRPKNVRRRLKKTSGRESRMQRDVSHCISKKLVQRAKGTDHALTASPP